MFTRAMQDTVVDIDKGKRGDARRRLVEEGPQIRGAKRHRAGHRPLRLDEKVTRLEEPSSLGDFNVNRYSFVPD